MQSKDNSQRYNGGDGVLSRSLRDDLRERIKGQVVAPGDAGYDKARTTFYGGFDHRPDAIVRVADAADVAQVVNIARENGLELAVRSGGHSVAGHSVSDGGVTIDLSMMKSLDIDSQECTAWAEAGLTTGEVTAAAAEHGLAIGFGDTGSVGIGGITLGGGVGFLARKYGLTIDNLLAAEIVTASGEILTVDGENHPDLFWAIRGGGGNFGVVTRFLYRLHQVGTVLGGMLILPAEPDVIAGFMAEAQAAPDELSAIANVMPAPPMPFLPAEIHGKMIAMALMVYTGDVETGQRVLAPFRAFAQPLADMLRPMRYPEIFFPTEEDYHPVAVSRTMFINRVDRPTAETVLRYLKASDSPMRVTQLRALGGAVARVPAEATAYAHRQAPIMVNLASFYATPTEQAERKVWVDQFAAALDQGYSGMYANFVGGEGAEHVRALYPGATWDRLAEVKARYDPTNLFHRNHNIPPAVGNR